ncbi:hypothetical protein DFP72DRAFT_843121 [Ephemerocybe angulata]|uniref:Protein kinase domain-containing protein n=1 Tax=Ephemerocybe angulata TaxID=980116 RepID=A0A8H6I8E3_9AGAR|nr:hypothetical protein DFP72DRAFT_843121 [Tulosesus angulatus]
MPPSPTYISTPTSAFNVPDGRNERVHPVSDVSQDDSIDLEKQRKAAIDDLHRMVTVDGDCLKDFYKNSASDRQIKRFLTASSLYDYRSASWTDLAMGAQSKSDLHARFFKVIRVILEGLGSVRSSRKVVDTRDIRFAHYEDSTQASKPSMSIKATGPSFAEPRTLGAVPPSSNAVGFSNVTSVLDVELDANVSEADVDHLAVYNRQIHLHQRNRLFSRSILLTQSHVRLAHCDRSGGYKTTAININDHPATLVRLILGLASPSEAVLGLDTSVQWSVKNGIKVSGTISTVDAFGKRVKYPLSLDEPVFMGRDVRGGGPVCWNARDKNGRRILLKDSWRTDSQTSEYTFLKRAQGLGGVVQMLGYEDARAQTKSFRPASSDLAADDFENRTMSRATLTRYGSPLHQFKSQRQVVEALRDAIKGHRNLLKAGVLHQDVSTDNILFGEDSGEYKGVVIDLGMAAEVNGPSTDVAVETPGGTYLYTSVCVLDALNRLYVPLPRDYLDDLESFFYVLGHLLYGFEGPGRQAADAYERGAVLETWEDPVLQFASLAKLTYLMTLDTDVRPPPLYWSSACTKLCDSIREYLYPIVKTKASIRRTNGRRMRKALLENLHDGLDGHYATIIAFFDTALKELDMPGGTDPRLPLEPSEPSTPPGELGSMASRALFLGLDEWTRETVLVGPRGLRLGRPTPQASTHDTQQV